MGCHIVYNMGVILTKEREIMTEVIGLFKMSELQSHINGIDGLNLTHGIILDVVKRMCEKHSVHWFGARRRDWHRICLLSHIQYDRCMKDLLDAHLIYRVRGSEWGTSIPVLFHTMWLDGDQSGPAIRLEADHSNAYILPRETER